MNSVIRQESIVQVEVGRIDIQDAYVQLGSFTSEDIEIFNTRFTGFRPIEFDNLSQFGVVYEVNLDLTTYTRTVYSFLDWVSDIGGLSTAIAAF